VTGDENPSHVVNVLVSFIAVPMLFVTGLGAVISLLVRFRRARGMSASRSSGLSPPPP
jgi:hypothetical protein